MRSGFSWFDNKNKGTRRMASARDTVRFDKEHSAFFNRLNDIPVPGRILDVVAGPGSFTERIAELFPSASIMVLDLSPPISNSEDELNSGLKWREPITRVPAAAYNKSAEGEIGSFDLISGCVSLRAWENLRGAMIILQNKLADGGTMLLHDHRRVPWLTWLPFTTPKLRSIRASYTVEELRTILSGLPDSEVSVQSEYPFMLTVTIRARRT